ncbi:MAG: hypothetical protein WKI04_11515 [Ferruginibacter sp.]
MNYNDMIDHVELSNEMRSFYMPNTASVLTDVSSLVSNYGSSTSDHFPVFTRYAFDTVILPQRLVSFVVIKQNKRAIIKWSTSGELNSKTFDVERSADNKKWFPVANISATGNSIKKNDYLFTDNLPLKGRNFYRLKQTDLDGNKKYLMTKSVLFPKKYYKYPPKGRKRVNTVKTRRN